MENVDVNNVGAVVVILGVVTMVGILCWTPVQNYIRGLKMKKERREELQHTYLSRLVGDVMDDIADGILTRAEANEEIFNPLKRAFNRHKALYPSEEWLKSRVKRRIDNGVHEPVQLPDPKEKKGRDLRKIKAA